MLRTYSSEGDGFVPAMLERYSNSQHSNENELLENFLLFRPEFKNLKRDLLFVALAVLCSAATLVDVCLPGWVVCHSRL